MILGYTSLLLVVLIGAAVGVKCPSCKLDTEYCDTSTGTCGLCVDLVHSNFYDYMLYCQGSVAPNTAKILIQVALIKEEVSNIHRWMIWLPIVVSLSFLSNFLLIGHYVVKYIRRRSKRGTSNWCFRGKSSSEVRFVSKAGKQTKNVANHRVQLLEKRDPHSNVTAPLESHVNLLIDTDRPPSMPSIGDEVFPTVSIIQERTSPAPTTTQKSTVPVASVDKSLPAGTAQPSADPRPSRNSVSESGSVAESALDRSGSGLDRPGSGLDRPGSALGRSKARSGRPVSTSSGSDRNRPALDPSSSSRSMRSDYASQQDLPGFYSDDDDFSADENLPQTEISNWLKRREVEHLILINSHDVLQVLIPLEHQDSKLRSELESFVKVTWHKNFEIKADPFIK